MWRRRCRFDSGRHPPNSGTLISFASLRLTRCHSLCVCLPRELDPPATAFLITVFASFLTAIGNARASPAIIVDYCALDLEYYVFSIFACTLLDGHSPTLPKRSLRSPFSATAPSGLASFWGTSVQPLIASTVSQNTNMVASLRILCILDVLPVGNGLLTRFSSPVASLSVRLRSFHMPCRHSRELRHFVPCMLLAESLGRSYDALVSIYTISSLGHLRDLTRSVILSTDHPPNPALVLRTHTTTLVPLAAPRPTAFVGFSSHSHQPRAPTPNIACSLAYRRLAFASKIYTISSRSPSLLWLHHCSVGYRA